LTEGEQARWQTAVTPIIDAYVQEANDKGLDGKKIVDTLKTAITDNPR
jgi:hypothetical protein